MIWLTEDVSLDLADAVVALFLELKKKSPARPSEKRFRELGPLRVVQAFDELVRRRLAMRIRKKGEDWYTISPEAIRKADSELLYELLKPRSDLKKKDVDAYSSAARSSQVLMLVCIVLEFSSSVSLMWYLSALSTLSLALTVVLGLLLVTALVLAVYFDQRARKHVKSVSREEGLATDLVAAYEIYEPFASGKVNAAPRKARNLIRKAANELQKAMKVTDPGIWENPSTQWRVLRTECEQISRLGKDLRMRVVPRMSRPEDAMNVANVIMKLARFLFEPSSSNMTKASGLMSQFSAKKASFYERLSIAITTRFWPRLIFCIVIVLGAGAVTLYVTNWNYIAAEVVIASMALVLALMTWLPVARVESVGQATPSSETKRAAQF